MHNKESAATRAAHRRQLTVLFSDLSDSTALTRLLQPEEYAEVLTALRECFEQVIPRHGGTITQVRGDGILAIFGLDAHEDEARRATEAALDLHAAVRSIKISAEPSGWQPLAMHSGIDSGLVLVVSGDAVHGQHVLVGDAANISARLSDEAARDEILVSETCLGADRNFYVTGLRRFLNVKGVENAVPAYPVLGRDNTHTRYEARTRRGLTAMVGRSIEIKILREALGQCRQGTMKKVSLVAAPGVGKTRLSREFLREAAASGCLVLRGYCESYLSAEPMQPILQMLRNWAGSIETHPDDWSRDTVATKLAAIDPGLEHHAATLSWLLAPSPREGRPTEAEIVAAFTQMLSILARAGPIVLFVDDWQWADDSTRRIYEAIGRLEDQAIMLLTAARENAAGTLSDQTVDLAPLSDEHSATIITTLIPNAEPYLIERLQNACGGNPLFLEELCHAAADISPTRTLHPIGVDVRNASNYLNALIVSRVARLPSPDTAMVHAAAVIGTVVPLWLLREVVRPVPDDATLAKLSNLDLLFLDPVRQTLNFKHGLTRDVVLETVGLHERRALHLAIAHAIERRYGKRAAMDHLEALAYHYGETLEFAQAVDYAESAGDRAMDSGALDRALLQYTAALKALDHFDLIQDNHYSRWTRVSNRLFFASLLDARPEHRRLFQRAVDLAAARGDNANAARAEHHLAYISHSMGAHKRSIAHCGRALAVLRSEPNMRLEAQVHAALAQAQGMTGNYAVAHEALNQRIAGMREVRSKLKSPQDFAYSLGILGLLSAEQGRFDESMMCFQEMDEVLGQSGHEVRVAVEPMRGGAYLWQGRWAAADESFQRTVALAKRFGSRYSAGIGTSLGGYARWKLNHDQAALTDLIRGVVWLEARDMAISTSLGLGWLTEVMAELGRFKEARYYASRALSCARRGEPFGSAPALCALATLPETERRKSAQSYITRAETLAVARGSRRERAVVALRSAQLRARLGNKQTALTLLLGCRAEFSEMGMYWHAGQAQNLIHDLGSRNVPPASSAA